MGISDVSNSASRLQAAAAPPAGRIGVIGFTPTPLEQTITNVFQERVGTTPGGDTPTPQPINATPLTGNTKETAGKVNTFSVSEVYQKREEVPAGVEPKFKAQKQWVASDSHKLFRDNSHKFNKNAREVLARANQETFILANIPKGDQVSIFIKLRVAVAEAKNNGETVDFTNLDNNNDTIKGLLIEYTKATQPKFQKQHYVKLDYDLKEGGKKVEAPRERYEASVRKKAGRHMPEPLVRSAAAKWAKNKEVSPREVNYGAVTESLASKIYDTLGFEGPKMTVRKGTHQMKTKKGELKETTTTKLYIDSVEARGKNGEQAQDFGSSIYKNKSRLGGAFGRFNNNQVQAKTAKGGVVTAKLDTKTLAAGIGPALLMGDYDKWGSDGGNMLFYLDESGDEPVAVPLNIDPGKALNPGKGKDNQYTARDVSSNASVIPPSGKSLKGGYKNFTLFMDTKLSERMKGIKDILDDDKWAAVMDEIDQAIAEHSDADDPDNNFRNELEQLKVDLNKRRDYFKEVFARRVDLSDDELDLVDNLEKLTSPTRDTATGTDEKEVKRDVLLDHLEVVPETRKEWNMEKGEDGKRTFMYEGPEAEAVAEALIQYISDNDVDVKIDIQPDRISFTVSEGDVKGLLEGALSEERIRGAKK